MHDFTRGSIAKQLILFSLPMLIGNVFQQVYSMADAVIVGNFVSGNALAAVGVAMSVLNFLLGALVGLTTGASVVISQLFGAKQEGELRRAVSTSIVFLAELSLGISVIGFIFTPTILRLVGTPADIFNEAVIYQRILLACMVFPIFFNMYMSYLRALGDSRGPLFILICATLFNVVLDLWFVVGFEMGIAGAAWATVIAQALAAVLCWVYAKRRAPLLRVKKLLFDRPLFRSILRYSIPAAIQMSLVSLASLTIMRLVNSFGYISTAGYTAAQKIDSIATMPLSNISMATSTFVAQNMGAGLEERAKKGFRTTMVLMVGLSLFISALAMLFGKPLITLFLDAAATDSTAILAVGTEYLSIIVSFYGLFAIFFAFNGFFRGVGDAVIVMALTITSLSIRALAAYFLTWQFDMGAEAVAWSIPIGWGLCSFVCFWYYRKCKWAGKALSTRRLEQ